jgi:hypothetical protein
VQQCQASHASQLDELGERFEACLAANRLLDEQLCSLRLKAQAQVTELLQLRAVRIVKILPLCYSCKYILERQN